MSIKKKFTYIGSISSTADALEKTLMLGKRTGRQEEKGVTEDEMVEWHH